MEKNRVLIFLVLISLVSFLINLSNAKLCAEESCKSVIATGVTTVRSSPKAKGYLGFRPNVPVKILSRKDGPKSDLCLVEIQGQVGLVSHKHILEKKIIIRMEDLIEIAEVPKEEEEQIQIKPSIKDIEPTHTESLPQVNPTQNIVTQGDSSNVSEEVSSEATPVVEESEIVDGTQLPVELDDKVTLTTEPTREEELEFDESMVSLNETSDEEMSASTEVPNLTVTDSILEDMKSTSRHLLFNEEDLFEVNSEKKDNIDESKEDIREQSIEGNLKPVQENNVTEEPKEIDPPKIIEGLVTPPETESKIEESVIEPEVPTELNKSQNQEEVKSPEKEETASDIIQSLPNLEGREKPTLNEIPEPHQDPISSTLSTPLSDDYHESFAHLSSSEDVTSSTTKDTIVGKVESENTNIAPEVSIQDVLPENSSTTTDSFEDVESEDEITPVLFEDVTSEEIISSGNVDSNLTDSENVPDKVILKDDDEDEKKTSYDPYSQIQHHHHDPYAQLHSHKHQLGHESHNQLSQESISEENHLNESNVEEMNHQKDLTKEREMISEEIIDIPSHKEVEADTQIHNEIQSKDHSHEHNYGNLEQEQESKIIPDYPTDSLHMLPPLMRRHGNQKQEISKIEVESKPALEEKVLVTESEEVKIAEPGFYDSLLLSITSLWSSNPGKKEDIVDIFSAPPISEHEGFCEKVGPNECPNSKIIHSSSVEYETCNFPKNVLSSATQTILDNINILAVTAIAGIIVFVLILSYNCMNNCKRESELISRLNKTERDLLASMKELDIARFDLSGTQSKLSSIEDNSFGSNDMVIALRKDLEVSHSENEQLLEQIENLEKELDTATEAGLELNKIIAELLSAQNGDENIVSSVEELQKQLNEQQSTILDINTILAQKSRENSELQILLAESNAKYVSEIESLKTDNEELENERNLIQSKLEEIKQGFEHDISAALESKNGEIRLLQTEIMQWKPRYDEVYKNWQTCEAKIEALQESLKQVKIEGAGGKPSEVLNIANIKADMSALKKENDILKERLESQMDSKSSMTEQLKTVTEEIEKIKQDFHQAEKDKLEAQTRLEVLSNYFKDKETQLQKELSVKEAMWLKQQGETTTTVERVKNMQEEIQSLKSQNDSLRAEIEAQTAAHKAQIGTLENRAHETWLAARQSERKYEEARLEGANLRRKLTQLSQNGVSQNTTDGIQSNTSINSAPSPVHMEAPGSPILQLPPPPPFLPPSFMGLPPPPMMGPGGAPPPFPPMFLPPGEIRPPPLGRLMSPPPHHHSRYIDDGNSILDDDYDDEYDDYNEDRRPRVYSRNGRFTPDSRYDYNSRYDTETDFSPPPSPTSITRSEDGQIRRNGFKDRDHRDRRGASQRNGNNGLNESSGRSKKGLISSGSEKSYNSRRSKGNNV